MFSLIPVIKSALRRYVRLFSPDEIEATCEKYQVARFRLGRHTRDFMSYHLVGKNTIKESILCDEEQQPLKFVLNIKERTQYWKITFAIGDTDCGDPVDDSMDQCIDQAKMRLLVEKTYNQEILNIYLGNMQKKNEGLDRVKLVLEGRRCYILDTVLNIKSSFYITYYFSPDVE